MKAAVVGSGHGGSAIAAVLAMRGLDVSILKLSSHVHTQHFDVLRQRGTIRLAGIEGDGEWPVAATTDPAKALADAEIVLVYYVTNCHPMVAEALAPYLRPTQLLVLGPGYAGSLLFEKALRARRPRASPLFAEFETLPYSSRIRDPGLVRISSRNVRHPFATYPAHRAAEVVDRLSPLMGPCVPRSHILETALHNPNLIIHSIGLLMNVSRVEDKAANYRMYHDGFTPSLWNLVHRLDAEKMDTLERLGARRASYFDEFILRTFEDVSIDPLEGFRRYASETTAVLTTLEHRYITEDVPMGLGLLRSLGRAAGVATPICASLIHIANALLPQHDFWAEARTIEKLWHGSLAELLRVLTA